MSIGGRRNSARARVRRFGFGACIQSISSLRRSLPSASANAKAIKRASGAIGAYFVSDKGNSSKPLTGLRCMYRDAREMNLLSYHCRQYALALPGKQIYSHGRV